MFEALNLIFECINKNKTQVMYSTSGTCLAMALQCSIEDNIAEVHKHFQENLLTIPNLMPALRKNPSIMGDALLVGEREIQENLKSLFGNEFSSHLEVFLDDYIDGNIMVTLTERNYTNRIYSAGNRGT